MKVGKATEDYLETILILKNNKKSVRAIDVAAFHGVSKPTVSVTLKGLRQEGYITVSDNNELDLTPEGKEIAKKVYERHQLFTKLLKESGVEEKQASMEACQLEHNISDESFEKLKATLAELGIAVTEEE